MREEGKPLPLFSPPHQWSVTTQQWSSESRRRTPAAALLCKSDSDLEVELLTSEASVGCRDCAQ